MTRKCMGGGSGSKMPRDSSEDVCLRMEEWN